MSKVKFILEVEKEIEYLINTGHSHSASLMEDLLFYYKNNPTTCDCFNPAQCWESCGDLGTNEAFAKISDVEFSLPDLKHHVE